MTEYQIYAVDANGGLVHATVRRFRRVTPRAIARHVREWEVWADGIAGQSPGCGTAQVRRKTVAVHIHPVGKPDECRRIEVPPSASLTFRPLGVNDVHA
jgi:hypothetical protein